MDSVWNARTPRVKRMRQLAPRIVQSASSLPMPQYQYV
jgi:hypothetical protein